MKGWYEDHTAKPIPEHEVARKMEWDHGISLIQLAAVILIVLSSVPSILFDEHEWNEVSGSIWRASAIVLLCSIGRLNRISWERWIARIPSVAGFYSYRVRRLAPVHILSIALVLASGSLLAFMGIGDGPDIEGALQSLIPLMPSDYAADTNPAWFILQACLVGVLTIPILSAIPGVGKVLLLGTWGGVIAILSPTSGPWATSLIFVTAYMAGAGINIQTPWIQSPFAKILITLAGLGLLISGQQVALKNGYGLIGGLITVVGSLLMLEGLRRVRLIKGADCQILYPLLLFHYPIYSFLAAIGMSGSAGAVTGITAALALSLIISSKAEIPALTQRRARISMTQRAMISIHKEEQFELSSHPKKYDNRGPEEK